MRRFFDRREAGQALAAALGPRSAAVVLGLPRGGVVVAEPVAAALGAPLDVIWAHKIGWPGNPESAAGAVGESGSLIVYPPAATRVPTGYLERAGAAELELLRARSAGLRRRFPALPLADRTAVVVDDGLATGQTMLAAVGEARIRGALRVVVAVPVGSEEAIAGLERHCDEVVCPLVPRPLLAVGHHYVDFSQTTDAEVEAVLARCRG